MHEIGHALGLRHPFDDPHFPISWDTRSETIMSYSAIAGNQNSEFSFEPTTPMPLDILAIQYLYGKNNTYHSGDDNYGFNDYQTYHETIWDSGGTNDWIRYDGSQNSTIDLREGMGSTIGKPVYATAVTQERIPNLWIAYDTVIENAQGGNGNDYLIANDADNFLSGRAGDDVLLARGGRDYLMGGEGNDIFGFDAKGDFYLYDFNLKEDKFFFDPAIGYGDIKDLVSGIADIRQYSTFAVVEFGNGMEIGLNGIQVNEITADMILFSL